MSIGKSGRINILDTVTANQIAAGEVVERPCSVVKELVENAIDAGATKIEVKIKNGGSSLISVTDNGEGMIPDDLVKCLLPHATSKIRNISDLNMLYTLGFRGEALSAIASVSKLTIVSKPKEQDFAYSIYCEGGKHQLPQEAAGKNGTTVEVKDLFFNTPARKKFLRSQATENGYISDYLAHLALSHPHIAFQYQSEGNTVLKTLGSGRLEDALTAVYGQSLLKELVPVQQLQPFGISGFISKPSFTKPSRTQYNFFINGRWVQSPELRRCVDAAYHTIIPQGRYPFVMLFLELPAADIDVNIHPAKLEIKFTDFGKIEPAVKQTLQDALFGKRKQRNAVFGAEIKASVVSAPAPQARFKAAEASRMSTNELQKLLSGSQTKIDFPTASKRRNISDAGVHIVPSVQSEISAAPEIPPVQISDEQVQDIIAGIYIQPASETEENEKHPLRDFRYSELRVLGQAAGTYIISTGEDALYITDQHAAHERLQYEKFKIDALTHGNGSAPLLIPINIELTHQEALLLMQHIIELTEMGFVLEHFGDNTFVLRAVPLWYEGSAPDYLIQDLLAEFSVGAKPDKKDILEEKLFMAACKSAVKGNHYQDGAQISALFESLDANPQCLTCPHGRPITVKITYGELQRRFLRSGI